MQKLVTSQDVTGPVKLEPHMVEILKVLVGNKDRLTNELNHSQQTLLAYLGQCASGKGLNVVEWDFDGATVSFVRKVDKE